MINYLLLLLDAASITVVLWISLLFIGGYVSDPENFIIVFALSMMWISVRLLL